jgi:hypothetical protein
MKIKSGYKLKQIEDTFIVVAVGKESANFNGMISLNETGAFIFEKLSDDISRNQLIDEITSEYDVDEITASKDVDEFVDMVREAGLLDE